jgi:hypothetical protein
MGRGWAFQEDGSIGQTLSDMKDPSVEIFTQAAAKHNYALQHAEVA